jgi:transcriptional regulator with XRE-family HTH domain
MSITPAQCRAARGLLAWSQDELAERSKVSKRTIWRFEVGDVRPLERTLRDLVQALEAGGIMFLPEKEGIHSATVALSWGASDPALRGEASSKQGFAGGKPVKSSPLDEDSEELMAHFWSRPEQWAALSVAGKQVLTTAMFGEIEEIRQQPCTRRKAQDRDSCNAAFTLEPAAWPPADGMAASPLAARHTAAHGPNLVAQMWPRIPDCASQ